jgi:hypothetical protein
MPSKLLPYAARFCAEFGIFLCEQSAVTMRVGARLAGAKRTLFPWSSTTSWTTDDECLFWAGFFFHVGEIMPQNRCTGMVNSGQVVKILSIWR